MNAEQIQHEDDLLITNDVARAIEERELVAYYQPVVELGSGYVVGAEALVRWTMPDGTVVPAGLFVPSLDRTDTIVGLDWYMAEEACSFLESAQGSPARLPVSVNFSARHARTDDFASTLRSTAEWHDVPLDLLRVELGQDMALTGDASMDSLVASVRGQGTTVVVDKYTLGVEGLDAVARRGITHLKVSRDYWSEQGQRELAAFVDAARSLGVATCADGIEQKEQAERLLAAGFEFGQGFCLGRPVHGKAFMEACAR